MTALSMDLNPGGMTLAALRALWATGDNPSLALGDADRAVTAKAADLVARVVAGENSVYGINTGFGILANKAIPREDVQKLQENLVLSHAAGCGAPLEDRVVRLVLVLKAASLAQGYSGVRPEVIDLMLRLLNEGYYPHIPEKGSVGASGDLAPLAHLAAALIGAGSFRRNGDEFDSETVFAALGRQPLTLGAKEGLAILNGTNVSTALALSGLFLIENVFSAAIVAGALSVDAMLGSAAPFDPRIQKIRGHAGQMDVAGLFRTLLDGSDIRHSHEDCEKVQDPYSLRCQPQVMGAALDITRSVAQTLLIEANAVTDNPLIFTDTGDVLSGGNFHAEPVAFAADILALAIAEAGSISERRTANLVDPNMSGLPAFLVRDPGVNSGFMIAQVTAAALVAENKQMAHPASIDSIPTSANQEDHVSMATHAARRLTTMAENAAMVVAIELLAAAQGVEFHRPKQSSPLLESVITRIREKVPSLERDRLMAPDMAAIQAMVLAGEFNEITGGILPTLGDAA